MLSVCVVYISVCVCVHMLRFSRHGKHLSTCITVVQYLTSACVKGYTALRWAIMKRHKEALVALLEAGAVVNTADVKRIDAVR